MRILSIDPGNVQTAFTIFDGKEILDADIYPNWQMLELLQANNFDNVVCEMVACYGMAVGATIFDTCLMIGNIQQICRDKEQTFELVFRKDIKLHICGQTRAKDSNIAQALRDRFGEKGTKKAPGFFYGFKKDMWQAFAVGVYFYDKFIGEKSGK